MVDPCESCSVPAGLIFKSRQCESCPYNEELWEQPAEEEDPHRWERFLEDLAADRRELMG